MCTICYSNAYTQLSTFARSPKSNLKWHVVLESQIHQKSLLLLVVFFETFFLIILVVPSAYFIFRVSDTLTREGSLLRSANYVLGAWNVAIIAGDMCQGMSNATAFKILMCGLGLLVTCMTSLCCFRGKDVSRVANILFIWNFLVFAQNMLFSFVAFLPQMIITPFHTSVILFSRYLVVIISTFTHYKFVHSLNSHDPNCKLCLLIAAEIASSIFPLYILMVIVSLFEIVF